MTAHQPLLLERRNGVAIISTSDAPINRMTLEFKEQLEQGIEELASDLVVMLFGYCLGSGLELPLECHFRLAAEHVVRRVRRSTCRKWISVRFQPGAEAPDGLQPKLSMHREGQEEG